MSRRKHRTKLRAPQNQRQVTESARGERHVTIHGYNADDESEAILAELPGSTMAERLESAKRGLFLGEAEPEAETNRAVPYQHQFKCGCGYIGRIPLMDAHQEKHRYRGIHAERRPYIQRTPTEQ